MLKKKMLLSILLLFLLGFSCVSHALEVETHRAINEYIVQNTLNGFSLTDYLNKNLGFTKGKDEMIKGVVGGIITNSTVEQEVYKWFGDGGEFEDAPPENLIPYRRSRNHFHNPLLPWDQAYYTDWMAFCSALDNPFLISGHCPVSAILWAQGGYQPQATTDWYNPGGDWSWTAVRNSYYLALTSTAKTDRDTSFANTFRGMGQLMHLVQDMSVPEHTRNDFHAFGGYEGYATTYVNNSGVPAPNSSQFFTGTISTIASFIDTDQYDGTSATINNTASSAIGLSEYTQANFFSGDSISTDTGAFPYPQITDTTTTVISKDYTDWLGLTSPRLYYLKECCGETGNGQTGINGQGYLLSTVDFLHDYRMAIYPILTQSDIPILDDNVYADYAFLLLPRAVGYSAGLLNYFFRGQMNADGSETKDNNGKITGITINVTNTTANEAMQGGTFVVSYRYKASGAADYTYGVSTSVSTGTLQPNASNPFQYSFSFSPSTIPTDATDKQYILVFQGTLGNETGAVVGKIITLSCTGLTTADYTPGISGSAYYEEIQSAYLLPNSDGTYDIGVLVKIKQDPSPSPYQKCFWMPWLGCWWYWYYPADPYSNYWDTTASRYDPNASPSALEYVKVWIDYNEDKTFSDSEIAMENSETAYLLYFAWPSTDVIVIKKTVALPAAKPCLAVMRVAMRWSQPPTSPSGGWIWGGVKDFQVVLE